MGKELDLMPMWTHAKNGYHVVCIVSPTADKYSETFIRAHIERLPVKIKALYGRSFPAFSENDDRPLLPWIQYGVNVALSRLLGLDPKRVHQAVLNYYPRHMREAALRRYLRRERVQAVLAEYGHAGVAIMNICREAEIPLIVHFHGFDAYRSSALEASGQRYPQLFESAAAIIAASRDMERQLLHLGARRENLYYNPYGVDLSLFHPADPACAPPVFVAVGRFVDKKAPHLTLLAFKKVYEASPEARLIMIGDGQLWEACRQLCRALGLTDAVEFLGPRSHLEVAATMRRGRAFVQHSVRPSHGDSEGTPVAVLEAGAAGLPVVATKHAGIQDVVIDGETGLLVDEGDVEGMAERMLRLANDPALATRLGRAARQRICNEFSMEKSIASLWCIIESAIQECQKR